MYTLFNYFGGGYLILMCNYISWQTRGREMRFKLTLLATFIASLFLSACGGGVNNQPYDGTWTAVYPNASIASTFSNTKIVVCNTPPAALVIVQAKGTTTQSSSCTTTTIVPAIIFSGSPPVVIPEVRTVFAPQVISYYISVNVEPSNVIGGKDVLRAIVNGASFTGLCISTIACSAVSAGDTLSLTR